MSAEHPCLSCGLPTTFPRFCGRCYTAPRREACVTCGKRKKHRQLIHLIDIATGVSRAVCNPELVSRFCMDRSYRGRDVDRIDLIPRRVYGTPGEAA